MASSTTPEHQQLAQAVDDGVSAINAASSTEELRTVVSALTGKKGQSPPLSLRWAKCLMLRCAKS